MTILMLKSNTGNQRIILNSNKKANKVFLNKLEYSILNKTNLKIISTKQRLNRLLIGLIWLSNKIRAKIKYKKNKQRPNIK